jgi:tetratricopeptide (TPR) repeat protein/SAM-dependent methyltransferase
MEHSQLNRKEAFAKAVSHHKAGNFGEAVRLYSEILNIYPDDAPTLHMRGFLAHQQKQYPLAEDLMRKAILHDPGTAVFYHSLGNAQKAQGRLHEAIQSYRQGLALDPSSSEMHNNVGNILTTMDALDEGIHHYERALVLRPSFVEAHNNLGRAYAAMGNNEDAAASYRKALRLKPDLPETHVNLGNALKGLGKHAEAMESYRLAVQHRPNFAEAHYSLGNALRLNGQVGEAVACLRRALEIKPALAVAWNGLALAYRQMGKSREAITSSVHSLQIQETPETRTIFVECIKGISGSVDEAITNYLVRAIIGFWGLASELQGPAIAVLWNDAAIGAYLRQFSTAANHTPVHVLDDEGFRLLCAHPVTNALLISGPICDPLLEKLLTVARSDLVDRALAPISVNDEHLEFICALARQCYVNDYIFSTTGEEERKVSELRKLISAQLEQAESVHPVSVATLAAYVSLRSLPESESLSCKSWAMPIAALVSQQLLEPAEEALVQRDIPRRTEIDDAVSLSVRQQYEESPYPKWIGIACRGNPKHLARYFADKFGFCVDQRSSMSTLIAGCGTGRHAIEAAWAFRNTQVLAIDLSMRSLAYALRKTRELGLSNLRYCQADILKLDTAFGQFDVIECVGVLHHLERPWEGFRVLLDHLKPGGLMKVGLYSRLARLRIMEAQKRVATRSSSKQDIRQLRQELISSMDVDDLKGILDSHDFYSLNSCRDLLFHVQEQHLALDEIKTHLSALNLTFIGFEIDETILASYRTQFPNDLTCRNLDQWGLFEEKNPDTFRNMYQFWLQKT